MDDIKHESLTFIEDNLEAIRILALTKFLVEAQKNNEEQWIMLNKNLEYANATEQGDEIMDINIWFDEEAEVWKGTAYPIELNYLGKLQTGTSQWIHLF